MLPMHSATDDDYTRSLSVTASVAYPVPVSASTTPANGDVVEIGKVRLCHHKFTVISLQKLCMIFPPVPSSKS